MTAVRANGKKAVAASPAAKLGAKIDELWNLQQKIREANAKLAATLEPITVRMKTLETEIIDGFTADEIAGASGELATAERKTSSVPTVIDWPAFYEHVRKTKSFDLLEKRVSATAWRERLEAGKEVPGVSVFHAVKLSVRKKTTKN